MSYTSKVSCICITKNERSLLDRAIRCFENQIHENKELVILYENDNPEIEYLRSLKYNMIEIENNKYSLGELRNIAINQASGEYIIQWDDDDLYRNDRIKIQLNVCNKSGKPGCVLTRWVIHYLNNNDYWIVGKRKFWEGSLMIKKDYMMKYPDVRMGEDTQTVTDLHNKKLLKQIDIPYLYIYTFHGNNVWNKEFWMNFKKRRGSHRILQSSMKGMIYD